MAWSLRPARPIAPPPTGPPRWLAASAAALAVVALASPRVFEVQPLPALHRPAAASAGASAAARPAPRLPGGADLRANVRAAAAYAGDHGWMTGIAVVDTTTGELTTAGNANGMFPAESTMKVFVAARLLLEDKMSGEDEAKAAAMIARSDDAAADKLYLDTGGDGILPWAQDHYAIPGLGTRPTLGDLSWGSTQVSPQGMARFLAKAKADPKVGPWLIDAMRQVQDTAADGTDQRFGLRAVDPTAPVKQGWGGDVDGGDAKTAPSIGYLDGGRYAVAMYTIHVPSTPLQDAQDMTTAQAKILVGQHPGS